VEIAGAATAKKSNSGMESLVVLLDHSLTFLPVEKLKVFTDIGAKSRDVSLQSNINNISPGQEISKFEPSA